jgi:TRAP-type C4-dicarboxylate transport system substrate-binding protein
MFENHKNVMRLIICTMIVIMVGIINFPLNASAKKIIWKLNNVLPESRPETQILLKFAADVKKRTNGEVEIKVFSGGSLGVKPEDTLRWLPKGFPEMAIVYTNYLGRDAPELANIYPLGAVGTPEEHELALPVVEGIIYDVFRKWKIEPVGSIRYAAGTTSIFSRNEPVSSLSTLRKKKIRVWSKHQVDAFGRLGVSALIIPQTEMYVALKTGVVDCALYPDIIAPTISLQEVVKYRAYFMHSAVPPFVIAASAKKWQTLSEEHQKHIKDAAAAVQNDFKNATPKFEAAALQKLKDAEVKFADDFAENDRQAFLETASETWKETCETISNAALENREKILKAIGR